MIPVWLVDALAVWLCLASLVVSWLALRAWRLGRFKKEAR